MTLRTTSLLVMMVGLALADQQAHANPADASAPVDVAPASSDAVLSAARPGFGDTTSTVPPWRLALETGMTMGTEGAETNVEIGAILVRMGITPWLEARVLAPGLSVSAGASEAGATDAGLGLCVGFALHDRIGLGLTTMVGFPLSDLADGEGGPGLSSSLNLGVTLSDTLSLAVTAVVGFVQPQGGAGISWDAGGAVALAASFDDTSIYAEAVLLAAEGAEATPGFGVGVARMLTDTLQIDLHLDYRMPAAGTDVLVGLGVATLL